MMVLNVFRVVAMVLVSTAAGMMARYYLTRPKMPVTAFIGFSAYTIAILAMLIYHTRRGEEWVPTFSIPAVVGAVAVIVGVGPHLRIRHRQ